MGFRLELNSHSSGTSLFSTNMRNPLNAIRLFSLVILLPMVSCQDDTEPNEPPLQSKMKEFTSHESNWKRVQAAEEKGRPETAIKELEPILAAARAEGNWAEAIKALTRQIALEGAIEGNRSEERIARLEAAIPDWPKESHPLLETVLAHWYWQFFQQNRWRFMERTRTEESPGEDILAWDLPRILSEIDEHFTAALSARDALVSEPVSNYDDLLEKGTVPDRYRPSLYDFIAHEALSFYTAGEQAGAKAQDSFVVPADSPVFGTVAEFLAWNPETTDTDAPELKAIQIYQDLLKLHQDNDNQDALADADLARLSFAHNTAFGPQKYELYLQALERFAGEWADHPVSARARADWANVIQEEGDLVTAHAIAKQGAGAFPDTPGGNECFNIVEEIEAKQSSLSAERVWNEPWPSVQLRYRNLDEVHFRVYRFLWNKLLSNDQWVLESLDHRDAMRLLKTKPSSEWSVTLPATEDFQEREELIDVPKDLAPGFYFIFASHDPDFNEENDNITAFAPFWVSNLALVTRTQPGSGEIGGFVLDAITGEPVKNAQVRAWHREPHDRSQRREIKPVETNEEGLFTLPFEGRRQSYVIMADRDGDRVTTSNEVSNNRHRSNSRQQRQTYFFTDRALYRPGQTIRYKGLCTLVHQEKDNYTVEKDRKIDVVFIDANGQEITRASHRTNDFGSFQGSFTAPRDRLMGSMQIRTEGNSSGNTWINVEEYKRPKFKVTLDAPEEAAKLNETVLIKGTATSYSGAAIDGATVSYRVVREVRYPDWWRWRFWWLPPQPGSSQEIAHGEIATAVDGTFEIPFKAVPDRSVSVEDEPIFRFLIHADVTDSTGETRSDSRPVNLGYTALQASLSAADWQETGKPVAIRVTTESLDGEGLTGKGTVKIHRLVEPETTQRSRLGGRRPFYPEWIFIDGKRTRPTPAPDPANPDSWDLGDELQSLDFSTDENGQARLDVTLDPGLYRAVLETRDAFGSPVTARLPLTVLDPESNQCNIKLPHIVAAPTWKSQPGETFSALWGTGYESGRAYVEIEHRGEIISAGWTGMGDTQSPITLAVEEAMRGGFTLRVTQVRENRAYLTQRTIDVPWSNKDLQIRWSHHTSKLEPGQKETWTATISGPDAEKAAAEIVATLYDESLDAYLPHRWMMAFNVFRQDRSQLNSTFQNQIQNFSGLGGSWDYDRRMVDLRYRSLPAYITHSYSPWMATMAGAPLLESAPRSARMAAAPMAMAEADEGYAEAELEMAKEISAPPEELPAPNLDQVSIRTNLEETAFFFPQLISGEDGTVQLEFTMPEALTTWKFFAFAHDAELRSGFLEDSVITQKDIMVQPNPPRFLREADRLEFTVKVINLSEEPQTGTVRLTLANARTDESADANLGNFETDQAFDIPAKESRTFSWKLNVPDDQEFLTYKAVASTGSLSDGESSYLPVLPRRILLTESLPLPIRNEGTREFALEKLIGSAGSDSIRHESLTVQMVSNPSWYAVMALPYLMEYPYQCSEQIFNRLYANSLSRHLAKSDPAIRRIFDQWKGTDALDSPLEKNEDLKSVMLEETPWVRQANDESDSRRNLGILFDDNRLDSELAKAEKQLAERQRQDGSWSWFPGGPGNDFITLYITTGYGRMRHLGVGDVAMDPAIKSLGRLDSWIRKRYDHLAKEKLLKKENLDSTIALYLYCRSFFLEDRPIASEHRKAVDYFLEQASRHWLTLGRQSQGHVALALHRFDVHRETPDDIVISLRETSKNEEEMGMYWRDSELSFWWYRAPIETQAMMIEVFDEVAGDAQAVEDLQVWMLKQKQTRDWKTTKATADAVYSLLLRGSDLLASTELVQVQLGDYPIKARGAEAGTGFYEEKLLRSEVKPELGNITVTKSDEGVAWGSLHWQYFESMENVTPHEGTPLKLEKKLYTKTNSDEGPVLKSVTDSSALEVGDELVVRLELRTDRDMEYVHLKDHRGSGTEPVNVLSRYRYQDGLGYYETTRDTASHFFIDYLPKGTYVFEYSVRVQHRGEYQSGLASIQCMYAPEFNSHSESFLLKVE